MGGTLATPDGARVLANIGKVKQAMEDTDGALEAYLDSQRYFEITGTLKTTVDGANVMQWIGEVKAQKKDYEGASEAYEAAKRIRKETNTMDSADNLLAEMAKLEKDRKKDK